MDIQTRLANLENLVNYLVKTINKDKFYTGTDISGVRQNISEITPYIETKTAYIGDTEVVFFPPNIGNVTVYFDKPYTMEKLSDRIIISFDELEEVTEVTISII